jgi:type IV pilus assembly protein PilA
MKEPLSERGFSIIELMVVVLIIAILIAIAIPTLFGARQRAQDRAVQSMLVNAAKAEAAYDAGNVGYTDDPTVLAEEEASLDWTGVSDDSVHVSTSADRREVLLYSRSNTGTWFGIRLDVGVRGTCMGPAESDVDDLADCSTREW